ncbi:MAG TPA: hypothetical protein VK391_05360 [Allosphingosinicella sp.]|nr:hypothetical protein [Allosphingosinicella sp.]
MRIIFTLPLLALAACNVDNDAANDKVTLEYDEQRIKKTARATARTAKEVGSAAGNVAASTGRAIKKEVGDVDVDVDVRRRRAGEAGNEASKK